MTVAEAVDGPIDAPTALLAAAERHVGARWAYSSAQQRLAVVDAKQLLMIIDKHGRLEYKVQLPIEGLTIFIGWEPGGSVLAAVQKLGGAFLWFPAKPENVQQWEGMQFSTKVLAGSLLKRNSHFDTCFASWSSAGKLVLGEPRALRWRADRPVALDAHAHPTRFNPRANRWQLCGVGLGVKPDLHVAQALRRQA